MDLTMCGLLVDRAEEVADLYAKHRDWNEVEERWFNERASNRSTKGSARKIFRVLTGRLKNAPASLPNPSDLPTVFDQCQTKRDKAQILFFYLIEDDPLVRHVVHGYADQLTGEDQSSLDFSDRILAQRLSNLEFSDGGSFDYAESTTTRWCEGFRSLMRELGVVPSQQETHGEPPSISDVVLLNALAYSYQENGDDWTQAPRGLLYLFQPETRWNELFDRAAETGVWTYVDLHGDLQLNPTNGPYAWIPERSET